MLETKILSDCDGVLLDWQHSFEKWMRYHFDLEPINADKYDIKERYDSDWAHLNVTDKLYLPRIFCNSSRIGSLKPLRDAVKYVNALYEEFGITIDIITSLSLDPETVNLREQNLKQVFGNPIDRVVSLDTNADKREALMEWQGSGMIWIEDKPENAELGLELGLDAILMSHPYNLDYQGPVRRVNSWREIYEYVRGE